MHRLSIDLNDNLYAVGNYENNFDIGGNHYTGGGCYLVKFDQFGNHIWHKIFTFPTNDRSGLGLVKTDGLGNIYISGQFNNAIEISGVTLTGVGTKSWAAKFNPNGDLIWTINFSNVQQIFDMAVNKVGEFVVYWPGSISLYDEDGTQKWSRIVQTSWPISTSIDDKGNVYFDGRFSGTLSIGTKSITGIKNYDLFIAKIDKNGICTLLKGFRRDIDPLYENTIIGEQGAMTVDEDENIYISSTYWSKIILGQFQFDGNSLFGGTFVAKFDNVGNVVWASGISDYSWSENLIIHNKKLYLSGEIGYTLYFSTFNINLGSPITPVTIPLEYVDILTGFGIDSKDSIYMSGRRRPLETQIMEGFLFKYKPKGNIAKGILTSHGEYCMGTDELTLEALPLPNADFYEWEISYLNNSFILQSFDPVIKIKLSQYSITGDFSVRVRGKSSFDAGPFSDLLLIKGEDAITLNLENGCKSITVLKGEIFYWSINNFPAFELGTEKIIFPKVTGIYHVYSENACGVFISNEITFSPISQFSIFIPNIITPNDDGYNQMFVVDTALENPSISIYNRWGKLVYQNANYDNSWPGNDLSDGNYYYSLKSNCLDQPILGWVAIKR